MSDVSHARRRSVRLHLLRRGTFRKRKDRWGTGKAPIDPLALIYSGPRRTPHTPRGRQYFRVWLGHQFVIKSSPLDERGATGPRVIILNRAAPGPSISSFLRNIYGVRGAGISVCIPGVEEGTVVGWTGQVI